MWFNFIFIDLVPIELTLCKEKYSCYYRENIITILVTEMYKHSGKLFVWPVRMERSRSLYQIVFQLLVNKLCTNAQSCPTLCDPMEWSPPDSSVHKNTRVGCHILIQGIFPTRGSNLHLLQCKQILYLLSHFEIVLDKRAVFQCDVRIQSQEPRKCKLRAE